MGNLTDGHIDRLVKARWLAIGVSRNPTSPKCSTPRFSRDRPTATDRTEPTPIACCRSPSSRLPSRPRRQRRPARGRRSIGAKCLLAAVVARTAPAARLQRTERQHRTKRMLVHLAEQIVKRQANRRGDAGEGPVGIGPSPRRRINARPIDIPSRSRSGRERRPIAGFEPDRLAARRIPRRMVEAGQRLKDFVDGDCAPRARDGAQARDTTSPPRRRMPRRPGWPVSPPATAWCRRAHPGDDRKPNRDAKWRSDRRHFHQSCGQDRSCRPPQLLSFRDGKPT